MWVLRYRLPSGKDSRKTLGKAWFKASRPPANSMTKAQAQAAGQRFLDAQATRCPMTAGRSPRAPGLHRLLRAGAQVRASTLPNTTGSPTGCAHGGGGEDPGTTTARHVHRGRPPRAPRRLVDAGRTRHGQPPSPCGPRGLRHGSRSVALAWEWMTSSPRATVSFGSTTRRRSQAQGGAHTALDIAVYTLAVEAGPRISEIRALKV